jgi:hypothetical protein
MLRPGQSVPIVQKTDVELDGKPIGFPRGPGQAIGCNSPSKTPRHAKWSAKGPKMFNEASGIGPERRGHADVLGILARFRPQPLKALAESLLDHLGKLTVIANRTGLVIVPMRDTVENVNFHPRWSPGKRGPYR